MGHAVWFHCFAGIAGDMALGSLIDAGADLDHVRRGLEALDVEGWEIEAQVTQRCGVRATHLRVTTDEASGFERTYTDIAALLDMAPLPARVKERALAIFTRLGEVEAEMHNTTLAEVHFHEVGGIDAIVDIVGTCLALEALDIDHIYASSIATGTGTVQAAHGTLPNPAPAVVGLLRGAPMHGLHQPYELTTPTGAAIVAALAERFGPMPDFVEIIASGFGAGTRDIEGLPNATQAIVGVLSPLEGQTVDNAGQTVTLLEINVDDVTGEVLAHCVARGLGAGAHDVWITPIIMKKGRPAHTISALVDLARADAIAEILIEETGSMGIRAQQWQRWPRRREHDSVTFDQQLIGIKNAAHRTKAEFDDAARTARDHRIPVREVLSSAEAAFQRRIALPPSLNPPRPDHQHPHDHDHPHTHEADPDRPYSDDHDGGDGHSHPH